jgi:hypothetical protein
VLAQRRTRNNPRQQPFLRKSPPKSSRTKPILKPVHNSLKRQTRRTMIL